MGMLADQVDHIIGVDTHRDSHSAAAVSPTGRKMTRVRFGFLPQ